MKIYQNYFSYGPEHDDSLYYGGSYSKLFASEEEAEQHIEDCVNEEDGPEDGKIITYDIQLKLYVILYKNQVVDGMAYKTLLEAEEALESKLKNYMTPEAARKYFLIQSVRV